MPTTRCVLVLALSLLTGLTHAAEKKNKNIGEDLSQRVERLVQKKAFEMWGEPWTMQGLPIVFPSSASGFNLGVRVQLQNVERQDPHKMEIIAQILASDRGRYKHMLAVDIPHALDGSWRFTARLSYDRDIGLRYFGIGNEVTADPALIAADSVLYQNVRAGPTINLQFLRYFGRRFRAGPIVGFRWTNVSYPAGSLLGRDLPLGVNGGNTHYFGLGMVYDTLDWEPYPSRGASYELFVNIHRPWTGSDYNFQRVSLTYRRYLLMHRRLIFAYRMMAEVVTGDVPFYELGAQGGLNPAVGFGSDRFFRGYDTNRFIDKIRLVHSFEFRWDPLFFPFVRQDITLGFVPFFEFGRVWPSLGQLSLGGWHASVGWGVRIIWNSRFIIRGDFALSREGAHFLVNLNNSF